MWPTCHSCGGEDAHQSQHGYVQGACGQRFPWQHVRPHVQQWGQEDVSEELRIDTLHVAGPVKIRCCHVVSQEPSNANSLYCQTMQFRYLGHSPKQLKANLADS